MCFRKQQDNSWKQRQHPYQVCYDVMVTFDMFPHTDSLKRERGRENVDLIWKPGEK